MKIHCHSQDLRSSVIYSTIRFTSEINNFWIPALKGKTETSLFCVSPDSERSEESPKTYEILRYAQDDRNT